MAIERAFPNNPMDVMYSAISFIQKWWRLLKPADQEKLTEAVDAMRSRLNSFNPSNVVSTVIVEIDLSPFNFV